MPRSLKLFTSRRQPDGATRDAQADAVAETFTARLDRILGSSDPEQEREDAEPYTGPERRAAIRPDRAKSASGRTSEVRPPR